MTPVVLFILAVGWTVYVASWLRSRRDRKGVNSISSFSHHLSVLERTSPMSSGLAVVPASGRPEPIYPAVGYRPQQSGMSIDDARRRRRNVLVGLAAAALATMVLIPFLGTFGVMLHLLIDVLLATYVVLLGRNQRLAVERREKVRYLPSMAQAEPQLLLQSSAN